MKNVFECEIVSAQEKIFEGLVEMIVVHASSGDIGIKQGHAPLLTDLTPGTVRIIKHGGIEDMFYISGGFMEVQPNQAKLLVDTAIRANDIDEAAMRRALESAKRDLDDKNANFDYSAASARLVEISAQLKTVEQMRLKHK